jgi:hypothetical protein
MKAVKVIAVKQHVARHFWKYDLSLHTVLVGAFSLTHQWVELIILVSEFGARKASDWFDELDRPTPDQTPFLLTDWSEVNDTTHGNQRVCDWL